MRHLQQRTICYLFLKTKRKFKITGHFYIKTLSVTLGFQVAGKRAPGFTCIFFRLWRDILSFRDLTQIQYGIPENAKFFDGIRDLTATREAGFAKILARDAAFGKKTVFGRQYSGYR